MQPIRAIETHTGGEPTRVLLEGGPRLGGVSLAAQREWLDARGADFRSAVLAEPRGSDHLVAALLTAPETPGADAGVIFFNNVACLGMCVHGTIGVGAALAHTGRWLPGPHVLDTPVGPIGVELHDDGQVSVTNVPSYRAHHAVVLEVPGHGRVVGDVAWGGNWFFLAEAGGRELSLANVDALVDYGWAVRQALRVAGVRGTHGEEIDHVELFGPPSRSTADSRNFVLCPGKAYDRSPCGTGTSAKLACLHADGHLEPGAVWRQESIVGSVFEGTVNLDGDRLRPVIRGSAWVTAESTLLFDPRDPFVHGIRP